MSRRAPQIAVVGGYDADDNTLAFAEKIGSMIAKRGAVLVSGGRIGVTEAACRGARSAGGLTVGIIPGGEPDEANQYVDVSIATGMGETRNVIIVRSADVVIALPGKYGTLSEIAFALTLGRPVISLGSWDVSPDIKKVNTPEEAVELAFRLCSQSG